jgi:Protein of unknown function (DUF2938)
MPEFLELVATGVLLGTGGSALIDGWAALLRRVAGVATLDYAMLGRWIGHFPQRRFVHERISSSDPVRGERVLGWIAHYSIGIAFAFALLAIWGLDWARSPTLGPAMIIGVATVAAPWFIMQPGMGVGFAGSRTPNPTATRFRNLVTHSVYGLGLYLSAVLVAAIMH